MSRRRVVVALVGAVALALVAAVAWNAPALWRRWESRNDIRVVTSLEELERQREVVIDGVPMKLGVDTRSPERGGAVLLHALTRSARPCGVVRVLGDTSTRPLRWSPRNHEGDRTLVTAELPVLRAGEQVLEVMDEGDSVRARCHLDVATVPYHGFFLLGPDLDPEVLLPGDPGAIPWLDGEDVDPIRLPVFPSNDARSSIRLVSEGSRLRLLFDRPLVTTRKSWPKDSVLARFWVNGAPVLPHRGTTVRGHLEDGFVSYVGASGPRDCSFRLRVDPGEIGARPGDRIGVQCCLVTCWYSADEPNFKQWTHLAQGLDLLSNRVEFTLQ